MLTITRCFRCHGHFVTHPHEIAKHCLCGICNPPARAGKAKVRGALPLDAGPAHCPSLNETIAAQ